MYQAFKPIKERRNGINGLGEGYMSVYAVVPLSVLGGQA